MYGAIAETATLLSSCPLPLLDTVLATAQTAREGICVAAKAFMVVHGRTTLFR